MINRKIKEYRKHCGLSQMELAQKMHVKQNTISGWETGRTEPNMGAVVELCKIFGCRPSDLIGNAGGQEKPLSVSEERLVALFRLLESEDQEMILDIVTAAVKRKVGE